MPRRLSGHRARAVGALSTHAAWRLAGETLLVAALGLVTGFGETAFGPVSDGGALHAVAAGLGAVLLALLRRRFPASVLLLTTLAGIEVTVVFPLLCVISWSAGRHIRSPGRATAAFSAACAIGFVLAYWLPDLSPSVLEALVLPAQTLVMILIPGLTSRYWTQRRVLMDVLAEFHAQQLRERTMIAGQARLRERQRIAQDMHDSLGHQLTLISVHLNAMDVDRTLSGRQRQSIGVLREVSVTAMRELRDVVGMLHEDGPPGAHGDRSRSAAVQGVAEERPVAPILPGAARIAGLVEASRGAGEFVQLRYNGVPRPLQTSVDHATFRIAQEALTNAHKYAPSASITLELRYEAEAVLVEVTNGPAPAPVPDRGPVVSGGQGLTGLRERTRLLGGTLRAGPTADGGFRVTGLLPYVPSRGSGGFSPEEADVLPAGSARARKRAVLPGAGGSGREGPRSGGDGLPEELAWELSRSTKYGTVAAACAFGAVLLLFVLPMVVALPGALEERDNLVTVRQYDAARTGMSEPELHGLLPAGARSLTYAPGESVPPEPLDTECLTFASAELRSGDQPVFRFCFRDGELVEKKAFSLP